MTSASRTPPPCTPHTTSPTFDLEPVLFNYSLHSFGHPGRSLHSFQRPVRSLYIFLCPNTSLYRFLHQGWSLHSFRCRGWSLHSFGCLEFKRSCSTDDRKYVLIRFNAKKEHPAEQFVAAMHKDNITDNKFWLRTILERSMSFSFSCWISFEKTDGSAYIQWEMSLLDFQRNNCSFVASPCIMLSGK